MRGLILSLLTILFLAATASAQGPPTPIDQGTSTVVSIENAPAQLSPGQTAEVKVIVEITYAGTANAFGDRVVTLTVPEAPEWVEVTIEPAELRFTPDTIPMSGAAGEIQRAEALLTLVVTGSGEQGPVTVLAEQHAGTGATGSTGKASLLATPTEPGASDAGDAVSPAASAGEPEGERKVPAPGLPLLGGVALLALLVARTVRR